jgi:hypothetical protein
MLDIEKAFLKDDHRIFLRAEQEMPVELLEDAQVLFWEALVKKKYQVSKFLMRKPYFNPILDKSKPSNWVSIICSAPDILQMACEHHIYRDRISAHDALILIKSALRIKFLNKKGIGLFLENFTYEELSQQEKFQSYYLLGQLFANREYFWTRKTVEWGVPINEIAINEWAKSGFHMNKRNKDGKYLWPHNEISNYKIRLLKLMHKMSDKAIKNIVCNNHIDAFLYIAKTFRKRELKNRFVIKISDMALSHPKTKFSSFLTDNFPSLLLRVFRPDERWVKLAANDNNKNISPTEKLLLQNKLKDIEIFAVKESNLDSINDPDEVLTTLKLLPKHMATLCIRYKARELGLDVIVPKITRKEHITMLLSNENDPMSVLVFSNKPAHQAYLMDRLSTM